MSTKTERVTSSYMEVVGLQQVMLKVWILAKP